MEQTASQPSEKNQVGDLMIMPKPQTSVWGINNKSTVASERRFMVNIKKIMSKVAAYYHIVFCTKAREMTIPRERRDDMYRFMWRIIEDMNCRLLRIGGIANHVHILLDLHPSVAIADLMKNVKGKSSVWMGHTPGYIRFKGWASEYFASTISPEQKDSVIEYIKGQETHHYGSDFEEEIRYMYRMADLPYNDKDLV